MRILSEQVMINAPKSVVWTALEDFGGVADWAPYMVNSHLIGELENGVGARRGMRHSLGFRFEEIITDWDDGNGFSFDVFRAPFPMKNVSESWICHDEDRNAAVSTRVSYEMHLGPLGNFLDWMLVRFIVRREMRAGLRGLKKHLESKHP